MADQRQSKVSKEGSKWEKRVIDILCSDERIRNNAYVVKGTNNEAQEYITDKGGVKIPTKDLKIEYEVNGTIKTYLIDNDIVVYSKVKGKIVCVISVKKSLRERAAQTAYWMLKKKEAGKDFKYIFVTPDVDRELYNPENPTRISTKWRNILTAEMDGVFVVGDEQNRQPYQDGKFYVGNAHLVDFVRRLL